ncbi:MAG TPA: hypothetical protein P5136_01035 [Methanofastidiosum sp.]|nr:hypothetical protein [Methanofastidiosum sp.]
MNSEIEGFIDFECENCKDKKRANLKDLLQGLVVTYSGDLCLEFVCKKCECFNMIIIKKKIINKKGKR